MQPDRFTIKSQEAIQAAQRLADERSSPQVTPEHLLGALLAQPEGAVVPVLHKVGIETSALTASVERALEAQPTLSAPGDEPAGVARELVAILSAAEREMREL